MVKPASQCSWWLARNETPDPNWAYVFVYSVFMNACLLLKFVVPQQVKLAGQVRMPHVPSPAPGPTSIPSSSMRAPTPSSGQLSSLANQATVAPSPAPFVPSPAMHPSPSPQVRLKHELLSKVLIFLYSGCGIASALWLCDISSHDSKLLFYIYLYKSVCCSHFGVMEFGWWTLNLCIFNSSFCYRLYGNEQKYWEATYSLWSFILMHLDKVVLHVTFWEYELDKIFM